MNIHFVCTGNTFRSRLAEAYTASLVDLKDHHISSSGILASYYRFQNGPVNWYTMRLIANYHLIPHMSFDSTNTTSDLLKRADLIIFMKQEHFDYAKENLGFEGSNYQIWNIPDLNEMPGFSATKPNEDLYIKLTEEIYDSIKLNVDNLVKSIT